MTLEETVQKKNLTSLRFETHAGSCGSVPEHVKVVRPAWRVETQVTGMLKTGQLQKIEKLVVNIFSFEFNVMPHAMDQTKNFVRKILPFLRKNQVTAQSIDLSREYTIEK